MDDKNNVTILRCQLGDLPKNTRILALEDNEIDREALARAAEKSDLKVDFQYVGTLEDLSTELEQATYDLAILNYLLPDGTGLEAIKIINESSLNSDCPTIMIATQAETTIAVAAMKSGCSDYILKADLTPATFRRAIVSALQKAMLRQKFNDAGRTLIKLQAAIRDHADMTTTTLRPMLKRSLSQINAMEFARLQSDQTGKDPRLEILSENCLDMLKLCDVFERDNLLLRDPG